MPRAKPKNWARPNLQLLVVDHLFPDDAFDELLDLLGGTARAHSDEVKNAILNLAGMLNFSLYLDQRPSDPEKAARLRPIKKKLEELIALLQQLDPDTREFLLRIIIREAEERQPRKNETMNQVVAQYRVAIERLTLLLGWTEAALSELANGKKGRPRMAAVRVTAKDLLEMKKRYTKSQGSAVTQSDLLKLLRAVALPVFAQYGDMPGLEAIVKEVMSSHRPSQADPSD